EAGNVGARGAPLTLAGRGSDGRPSAPAADGEPVEGGQDHPVDAIVGGHAVVELPDGAGVVVAVVVGDAAGPQDVVGQQHTTGPHAGNELVPVVPVAALVGVDEREVDRRLRRQRPQRVERGGDAQLDAAR